MLDRYLPVLSVGVGSHVAPLCPGRPGTATLTAATRGARQARVRIQAAPDRNDFWTAFGPTNVALHQVSTAVELGDAGEVVRKGEALDPSRFPPSLLGRRAGVHRPAARLFAAAQGRPL